MGVNGRVYVGAYTHVSSKAGLLKTGIFMMSSSRLIRVSLYIPYSRKFWREEYLADCSNNGIWRILLWRLGKPYTIIIFIAKW